MYNDHIHTKHASSSRWVLKASWSVSKVLTSTSVSTGVWAIMTCSFLKQETSFCLLAIISSISKIELWRHYFCIPSCSNSFLSASYLASRIAKSTFNDWWRFVCTPLEFRVSTIWDTIIAKRSLCTSEDIFIEWVRHTASRWSTFSMYFSI